MNQGLLPAQMPPSCPLGLFAPPHPSLSLSLSLSLARESPALPKAAVGQPLKAPAPQVRTGGFWSQGPRKEWIDFCFCRLLTQLPAAGLSAGEGEGTAVPCSVSPRCLLLPKLRPASSLWSSQTPGARDSLGQVRRAGRGGCWAVPV